MTDKIKIGALAYRQRHGLTEWLLTRSDSEKDWELPKSEVKRGESSVRAAIRYLKESLGVKATVLDEAGSATFSTVSKGTTQELKMIFYLMRKNTGRSDVVDIATKWIPYNTACRRLRLAREQKMLRQASGQLKEWLKARKIKGL